MPSLSALIDGAAGALRMHGERAVPDGVELSGVHISELADPRPFLDGGELLLTTGMPFHGRASHAYFRRLADGGTRVLGLGLGVAFESIPETVVAAAAAAGVLLVEVPRERRFLEVSRAYWNLEADGRVAGVATQLGALHEVTRAAVTGAGRLGVLRAVAGSVGGWAALLDAHDQSAEIWPAHREELLPGLRREVQRINLGGMHGAASFQLGADEVVEYPVRLDGTLLGYLCVGAGRRPDPSSRRLVRTAADLLGLISAARGSAAGEDLADAIAQLLIAGHEAAAGVVAARGGIALPPQVRVLATPAPRNRTPQQVLHALLSEHEVLDDRGQRVRALPREVLVTETGSCAVALVPFEWTASSDALGDRATAAALSQIVPLAGLGRVVDATVQAALHAPSGRLTQPDGLPELARAVEHLTTAAMATELETVVAYLTERGSWERAARRLGAHRNTVRQRIARFCRETGVDLDDPTTAARLWLLLR